MKNQTVNLVLVFVTLYLGLGAFFPFNSLYLQDYLHYSGTQIGLFYALAALLAVISVPVFGIIADKLQSPKIVYFLCALATIVFLIPYSFLKPFFIVTTLYILINAIRSALVPLIDTIALDYSYQTNSNYGILRSIASLSFIVSSVLVGLLLDRFSEFGALFIYIHLIMIFLTAIFILRQKNIYKENSSSLNFRADVNALIKNKKFILIILIMGLSYGIIQVSQAYIALSITAIGGQADDIGISFFFMVVPEVIFFSFILKFTKKINHIYLMLVGALALLLRWIVLLLTNSMLPLFIVSTGHGLVMAFIIIVGFDLIKRVVNPNLLASAMSLYTALANVSYAIISFGAGVLMNDGQVKNTYFLYIFTTIILIAGIIIYIEIYLRRSDNGQ